MDTLAAYLPFLGYSDASTAVPLGALLVVSVVLDLWLTELLLFRGPRPVKLALLVLATVAMGCLLVLKSLAFSLLGLDPFGMLLLAAYTLALVVPLVGARLLWRTRGERGAFALRLVAVAAILCLPLAHYVRFVEPLMLRLDRVEVLAATSGEATRPLRIGVLSDLQCEAVGEHEREAVRLLVEQRPDLILIPGDLIQGSDELFERWFPELCELLDCLHAPGGVYLVVGDIDTIERCQRVASGTDLTLLLDDLVEFEVAGLRVRLLGVAPPLVTFPGRVRAYLPETREALASFAAEDQPDVLRVLLSHKPRVTELLPATHSVALAIAGHTHGGQVVLPLLGPLMCYSPLPRSIAGGGLHDYRGVQLYVSRGVGLERNQAPRLRLLCPPEVGLVEVRTRDQPLHPE